MCIRDRNQIFQSGVNIDDFDDIVPIPSIIGALFPQGVRVKGRVNPKRASNPNPSWGQCPYNIGNKCPYDTGNKCPWCWELTCVLYLPRNMVYISKTKNQIITVRNSLPISSETKLTFVFSMSSTYSWVLKIDISHYTFRVKSSRNTRQIKHLFTRIYSTRVKVLLSGKDKQCEKAIL